jgi:hypothetical protein
LRQEANYQQIRDKQSLLAARDRILTDLMTKHRLGSQSPKIQIVKQALNEIINMISGVVKTRW